MAPESPQISPETQDNFTIKLDSSDPLQPLARITTPSLINVEDPLIFIFAHYAPYPEATWHSVVGNHARVSVLSDIDKAYQLLRVCNPKGSDKKVVNTRAQTREAVNSLT